MRKGNRHNAKEKGVYSRFSRGRLSCGSVKAYGTMPKGIINRSGSLLFDLSSQCFSAKEGEITETSIHYFPFYQAKTP